MLIPLTTINHHSQSHSPIHPYKIHYYYHYYYCYHYYYYHYLLLLLVVVVVVICIIIIIYIYTYILHHDISPWLNPYITTITTIPPQPLSTRLRRRASGTSCAAASKLLKASKKCRRSQVHVWVYIRMYTVYIYIYIYIYIHIYLMYMYIYI